MSDINFSTIQTNYPVAGQDNNSQGFRDNFSAISTAFSVAKSEITALETRAMLVADLAEGTNTVVNNLNGSSIVNGVTNRLYAIAIDNGNVTGTESIDLANGILQVCKLTANTVFTFINWPDNLEYGHVRVHLLSDGLGAWTPTFETENGGDIIFDTNFPDPFIVPINEKHEVIEAWTYNGGSTVYVRFIGEF